MKPFQQIPFTNEFGQVIQPGDSCVVVAKGYSGAISTYKGRYMGVRPYTRYYQKDKVEYQVVAEVDDEVYGRFHPQTGKQLRWGDPLWSSVEYEHRTITRFTNLWLNLIYPSSFA